MASTDLLTHNPDVGYFPLVEDEYPMTLHVLLFTAKKDGFVWITEHSAFLGQGHGNFAGVEKVTHLGERGIAYSAWGDLIGLEALGQFGNRIEDGSLILAGDDPAVDISKLRDFANSVLPMSQRQQMERPDTRGLIVAVLGKRPRVYRLGIVQQPVCFEIYDRTNATAGDVANPANLFVQYYYPRCKKTLKELLAIGLHSMRLARLLNSGGVGEPDAWVCDKERFRQLSGEEISEYMKFSESLDGSVLNQFSNGPDVIC